MGNYRIKIGYSTGNSFGSEDTEDYLELEWNDRSVAHANLQRIKEHYQQYKELNSYAYNTYGSKLDKQDLLAANSNKDWFVKDYKPFATKGKDKMRVDKSQFEKYEKAGYKIVECLSDSGENQLILYTDEGKPWQLWPFWCGYFESLHYAEIVGKESRIEF